MIRYCFAFRALSNISTARKKKDNPTEGSDRKVLGFIDQVTVFFTNQLNYISKKNEHWEMIDSH